MEIRPLVYANPVEVVKAEVEGQTVFELSEKSVFELLEKGHAIQSRLRIMPLEKRLQTIDSIGRIWNEELNAGKLEGLAGELSRKTGYSRKLIDMEFSLVTQVFNAENLRRSLESSFPAGPQALEKFVKISGEESIRYMPAGPVFIISSGNSLIPPLIPTTISIITGNFTLLRPSFTNYFAVIEAYKLLGELAKSMDSAKTLSEALAISYFLHNSPAFKNILSSGKLGLVNFWGGEPARTIIGRLVSENQHHPRYVVNGPLTGFAIVDEDSANEECARGLALNIILYDQQLCSSPTMAVFIGSWESAVKFAELLAKHLDIIGSEYPVESSAESAYLINSVRRIMQVKGSKVYFSTNPENLWTIALSEGECRLDYTSSYFPAFNLYNRKRFLEILIVDSHRKALTEVERLPLRPAFNGVDKVQTVGLAVNSKIREALLKGLVALGVYRVTPIPDMYMRSSVEPYDGMFLASVFTYAVYSRVKV